MHPVVAYCVLNEYRQNNDPAMIAKGTHNSTKLPQAAIWLILLGLSGMALIW